MAWGLFVINTDSMSLLESEVIIAVFNTDFSAAVLDSRPGKYIADTDGEQNQII